MTLRYTRILWLVAIVWLLTLPTKAQNYVIIHVNGKITLEETNAPLKRGDRVDGNKRIRFDSPDAVAAVLSSDRGRFILKPGVNEKSESDLFYILKSAVTPMRGRMSTRAGGINNALDFAKFFGDQFAFAGENLRIKVSPQAFPQSVVNFFYMQYQYSGESINKKLDFNSDTLVINRSKLFSVDDKPVPEGKTNGFKLFYYDASKESSTLVNDINFVLISDTEFKEMISTMQQYEVEIDSDSVMSLISELYGKCQRTNIDEALALMER